MVCIKLNDVNIFKLPAISVSVKIELRNAEADAWMEHVSVEGKDRQINADVLSNLIK